MVKEITRGNTKYFQCDACEMFYADKNIAQECEDWCRKNNSCNLNLIKHAIKDEKIKTK